MRLPFLIAAVSVAILAYEVALMRALSVAQGHHFAYMVVSTALLGFGASGTLLSLCGRWLRRRFEASMTVLAAAFAIAIPASFALAQQVPFDIFQLAWDRMQYLHLLNSFLICFVPFLLGATCIGLALMHETERVHSLYFWNLLGSGIGSAGIVAVMFVLPPAKLPLAAFAVAAAGTILYSLRLPGSAVTGKMPVPPPEKRRWHRLLACGSPRNVLLLAVLAAAFVLFTAIFPLELKVSQYKALRSFLDMGAQVVEERTSPLGTVDVLDGPMIRLVPGLSLAWQEDQPRQRALVVDAGSASAIYRLDDPKQAAVFDYTTSALPYHLLDKPKTLIIGAGGGGDVWLARYHGCPDITALELDPTIADLMTGSQADFAGRLYSQPGVKLVVAEARGFLARTNEKFDLIQLPLVESFGAAGAGVAALNESYLYTVEAFRSYLDRLTPNGILCVTRWLRNPVADCDFIRILSTVIEAMGREDTHPALRIMALRGMFTATVCASPARFSEEQEAAMNRFRHKRGFDAIWTLEYTMAPDCALYLDQANIYNRIPEPYQYLATEYLLGLFGTREKASFIGHHPFDITPTTDDRPYHSLTQRWRGIRHLREKLGGQWVRYADWGYIVLWATLAQAVLLSAVLILVPLFFLGHRRDACATGSGPGGGSGGTGILPVRPHHRRDACATGIYFACLGVAYMFIEIVMMQKLALFLASPIYAAAIVLAAFMVASGLGSLAAGRGATGGTPVPPEVAVTRGVLGILGVGLLLWFGMDWLLGCLAGQAFAVRALAATACAGGLAFFMGMPFPSGLRQLAEHAPALTPWAWGVNGAASVVGAVLAMVLAVSWGFRLVLLVAFALYVVAGVVMPRMAR